MKKFKAVFYPTKSVEYVDALDVFDAEYQLLKKYSMSKLYGINISSVDGSEFLMLPIKEGFLESGLFFTKSDEEIRDHELLVLKEHLKKYDAS